MATWDEVSRIAGALPDVQEEAGSTRSWKVRTTTFAWERPLRRGDLAALGPRAPDGPVLAAHVPDLGVRAALIADDPATYFTTPHFAGYPAALVELDVIGPDELAELLVEAWLARAPKRLVAEYLRSFPAP